MIKAFIIKLRPLAAALFVAALYGCAGPSARSVIEDVSADPSKGAYIRGVPVYEQEDNLCGPASLASVMGYWGGKYGMGEIAREVYSEKLRGTLPMDLLIYAKEKGFAASFYRGNMEDLRKRISEGTPPILFLNLGYRSFPVGHYIVAVGYSDRSKAIVANTGRDRTEAIPYDKLDRAWEKTGYSTLLITPQRKE